LHEAAALDPPELAGLKPQQEKALELDSVKAEAREGKALQVVDGVDEVLLVHEGVNLAQRGAYASRVTLFHQSITSVSKRV
jgi:hypothetical protein